MTALSRPWILIPLAIALWSLIFRGFDGGRWSDVPIVKSFVDPELYTRDPFVYSLHDGTPAAYTYQIIAAVVSLFPGAPIELPLFLLYLPASVISLALLFQIATHLVGDRVSTVLFLLLYVAGFRLFTVGSTILHSAELTPAFLALPLQLGAIFAMFRRAHLLAGALAGLALNVHAPTSSYVAAGIAIVYLLGLHEYRVKTVAATGAIMLVCGSPAILGAIGRHSDALPGWALQLARIELATDLSVAVNWERAGLRLRNLAGLGLLVAALAAVKDDRDRRIVLRFFIAVAVMCAVALVFIDVSLRGPLSTLVARLQFPRSVWIVNVLGLTYVAHYTRGAWTTGRVPKIVLIVLVASMLAAPSGFVPLDPVFLLAVLLVGAAETVWRWRRAYVPTAARVASVVAVLGTAALAVSRLFGRHFWVVDLEDGLRTAAMAGALALAWLLGQSMTNRGWRAPAIGVAVAVTLVGAYLVRGSTEWLYQARHRGGLVAAAEFQDWVRTQTPKDSVFLILPSEPNNESFYQNAERALFLIRERANQAVYFREHNFEFRDRVLGLGVSDVLRYREELDPMYRRLTEDRIRDLAARYGVTHFVPARAGEFSFPIVYQSGGWTVYEVSGPKEVSGER